MRKAVATKIAASLQITNKQIQQCQPQIATAIVVVSDAASNVRHANEDLRRINDALAQLDSFPRPLS